VTAAPPIKYVLGYRTLNPITNPNPNCNPKINKKQNDTGMKLNIELYLKVDFLGTGWIYKRPKKPEREKKHIWIFPSFSRSIKNRVRVRVRVSFRVSVQVRDH